MPARRPTKSAPAAARDTRDTRDADGNGETATGEGDRKASRRQERRLLHQDLSRSQLLDAAEEVFGRKGFHATTLKEVAELAEFSVGSVYSFFDNKDDLYLSVFLRRGAEFMPGMREVVQSPRSPLQQLHALVDYEVGFFREHRHFGRLYLRSFSTSRPAPEMPESPLLADNLETAMELQADVFARGQALRELRNGDVHVLARLFSGMVAAYQSLDPAVMSDEGDPEERLPLADLHDMIERSFRRD
ncbi:MAG: TetR/AcrR family transcriptional regulator [Acidimicrobiales bacterium]